MRVLFNTNPGEGQLYPMVPLAWALHVSGHDVLVAATEDFLPKITRIGLPAAASSEPVNLVEIMTSGSGGELRPTEMSFEDQVRAAARGFAMVAERTADGTAELIGTWHPDLVIAESTAFAAPIAAARHGVPFVEHRPGPALPGLMRKLAAEELSGGLPEPALIIDNCPPSFQLTDVPSGHVTRYVPYNGPGVVTDWMLAKGDTRRVCVTLGTNLPHAPGSWSLLDLMIATLNELPVELVIAVPNPDEVRWPDLAGQPASVRGVGRFPLSALVPTCDLVINHAGAGSSMTTIVAGLPQLCIPHYGDDIRRAQQVAERGVGLAIPAGEVSPGSVKAAVTTLLDDPRYQQAAGEVARENLSLPGPLDVVDALQALVS
ncbi:MAG TPA: nucleotide disphospho-sugar-binding domain-containing protein [Streptosporangiaceae bacterium]|nr:nucleotide disphospho-sugar-binding domain-containing protein [Streptosporangiaceae bacterium]